MRDDLSKSLQQFFSIVVSLSLSLSLSLSFSLTTVLNLFAHQVVFKKSPTKNSFKGNRNNISKSVLILNGRN
jgi:hypothetical protein